ncbi:MAG: site-specific integrase, partial [Rhodocyclaceae bacterium]|nr:site-specific integrase [Rhodocyclaceae bacterium]
MADDATVEQFLAELAHQRRASPHTIAAYRHDLARLVHGVAGRPLAGLSAAELRRQAMRLHGEGLSARSVARTLSAWRAYYRWLARRGAIAADPCLGLRAPKRPRLLPKALAVDQVGALLDAPSADRFACRDRAMFELFYSSGLRLAELVSLDVGGGLDLAAGEVTVTGKRGKTRTVPVGKQAGTALAAWLAERARWAAPGEAALFVSQRGTR